MLGDRSRIGSGTADGNEEEMYTKYSQDHGQNVVRFTHTLDDHADGQFFRASRSKAIQDSTKAVYSKKQKYARRFFWETSGYMLFMVVFCVVTYSLRTAWLFYVTDAIRSQLLLHNYRQNRNFRNIQFPPDVVDWMDGVFFDYLFPLQSYNGRLLDSKEQFLVSQYSLRIGKVRIKQVRVKPDVKCAVNTKFTKVVRHCYPEFNQGEEDTAPLPFNNTDNIVSSVLIEEAFRWRSEKELCTGNKRHCDFRVYGRKRERYPSSGYALVFDHNGTTARAQWAALKRNKWIDIQTRAIAVDFNLYNAQVNSLLSGQLLIEFYPTGGIFTTYSLKPLPILSLRQLSDYAIFIGEILLMVLIAFYLRGEIGEFFRYQRISTAKCIQCRKVQAIREGDEKLIPCMECNREFNPFRLLCCPQCNVEVPHQHSCWKGYFQDTWNYLDIINHAVFLAVFVTRFILRKEFSDLKIDLNEFISLYPIGFTYALANWLNSVNALFCFMKTFKYFSKFKYLSALVVSLRRARDEVLFFVVIFLVLFVGFALSFNLGFGTDLSDYSDWTTSLSSLFLSVLGQFDYPGLVASNRVLAHFLFILYQLLFFFVLSNMFIAIISGSYEATMDADGHSREDFLSSALKLYMREIKQKLYSWLPGSTYLEGNRKLLLDVITYMLDVEDLTSTQRDELNVFRHEVEHTLSLDLISLVLEMLQIESAPVRDLELKDFRTVKEAVQLYRKEQQLKVRVKIWESHEEFDRDHFVDTAAFLSQDRRVVASPLSEVDPMRARCKEAVSVLFSSFWCLAAIAAGSCTGPSCGHKTLSNGGPHVACNGQSRMSSKTGSSVKIDTVAKLSRWASRARREVRNVSYSRNAKVKRCEEMMETVLDKLIRVKDIVDNIPAESG